jgi:lipoate-protein ligase A
MRWSADFYRPVLDAVVSAGHRGTFSLSEHDYVLGDRKFGGNAQTISRDRWVHHTSLLWDFAPAHMALLQLPEKRPDYRRDRPHSAFLTRLRDHAHADHATPEALFAAAEAQLRTMFEVEHADPAEAWEILAKTTERQTNAIVVGER